nr:hypothetical protein [Vampirovibrio sp.]
MHPGTLKKSIVLNRWLIGSYLVMSMVACQLPLVKLVWPGWQWIGLMFVAITSLAVNEWLLKVLYKASEDNEKRLEKLTVVFPIFLALITLSAYAVTGDPLLTGFMALPVLQAHVVGLGKLAKRLFMGMLSFTLLSVLVGYPKPSLVLAQNPLLLSLAVIPLMVTLYQYGKVICGLVRITHSQVNHLQSLAATDGLTGLINRRQ